jgi:hypothetical protein
MHGHDTHMRRSVEAFRHISKNLGVILKIKFLVFQHYCKTDCFSHIRHSRKSILDRTNLRYKEIKATLHDLHALVSNISTKLKKLLFNFFVMSLRVLSHNNFFKSSMKHRLRSQCVNLSIKVIYSKPIANKVQNLLLCPLRWTGVVIVSH